MNESGVGVDRLQRLELDVDARLAEVWAMCGDVEEWTLRMLGELMRTCYVRGYESALTEASRGRLYRDNGYATPVRP